MVLLSHIGVARRQCSGVLTQQLGSLESYDATLQPSSVGGVASRAFRGRRFYGGMKTESAVGLRMPAAANQIGNEL